MVSALRTVTLGAALSWSAWSLGTRQIQSMPPVTSSAMRLSASGMTRNSSLPIFGVPIGLPGQYLSFRSIFTPRPFSTLVMR